MRRGSTGAILACLVALGAGGTARGASPVWAAQVAFDEGRRLEDAGDFAAAAARFEESERLAPALGTILNLANCYEHVGRLASAWRAFSQGADEATAVGETKRARRASDRADALRPRLSTITVRVTTETPGEEIRLDGAAIERAAWGTPQPVDGGKHQIVARVEGAERTFEPTVAIEGEAATVDIPVIVPTTQPVAGGGGAAAARPAALAPPLKTVPAGDAATTWTAVRLSAIASAGAGLVGIGFGVGYGLQARARWNDRQAQCAYNYCNDEGYALTQDARDASIRSTVAFSLGAVGLVAGATLYLVAPRRTKRAVTVRIGASPSGTALRVGGVF